MSVRWHARGCVVLSADWLPRILQLSLLSFTIRALSGSAHLIEIVREQHVAHTPWIYL